MNTSESLKFDRRKPVRVGRYTWRLPEAEKEGTFDLQVVLTPAARGGLLITTREGDDICTVAKSRGGWWAEGWANVAGSEEGRRPQVRPPGRFRQGSLIPMARLSGHSGDDL